MTHEDIYLFQGEIIKQYCSCGSGKFYIMEYDVDKKVRTSSCVRCVQCELDWQHSKFLFQRVKTSIGFTINFQHIVQIYILNTNQVQLSVLDMMVVA